MGLGTDRSAVERTVSVVRADEPLGMLDRMVEGPRAWTRQSVRPEDWTLAFPTAVQREIASLAETLRAAPLPILLLHPDQFQLQACRDLFLRVREAVTAGMGMVVLDALPMDDLSPEEAAALYWVLGRLLSRPVATKWNGTMIYDVTDTAKPFGDGVRGSATNVQLSFHTDNAFGLSLPDYVGLLCVHPASSGGISRACSLYSAHNEMFRRHARLLRRLYEPAFYDRQAEHAPEAPGILCAPLFYYDGKQLSSRLTPGLIRRGYQRMETPMDTVLADALECLEQIVTREDLWIEFQLERGQIQFMDNRVCAHYRSAFTDGKAQTPKRHLLRVWYRETGLQTYDG